MRTRDVSKKIFAAAVVLLFLRSPRVSAEEKQRLSPFGEIYVYSPAKQPVSNVVIMISGDGGWMKAVVELAELMSAENSLVVGIDIREYLKNLEDRPEKCSSPATDFQSLGRVLHEKYRISSEIRPILVGYSSGATLAYAAFVQAPVNAFRAAFSFGFCPDLPLKKTFCKGNGLEWDAGPKGQGFSFRPATHFQSSWIVFQGMTDQVCKAEATRAFVEQVPSAELVLLPRVGHGYANLRNWLPQFQKIFSRLEKKNTQATND